MACGVLLPHSLANAVWASETPLQPDERVRVERTRDLGVDIGFSMIAVAGGLFATGLSTTRFRWLWGAGVVIVTLVAGWALAIAVFVIGSTSWMGLARKWTL